LPAMVLIETTRAIFNNRRRVKLVLKDIEFIRSRFIQPREPLLPLKLMGQSRRGVTRVLEAYHPLVVVIPRFIQVIVPLPLYQRVHLCLHNASYPTP
jgi:hypothetical protein